MSVRCGEAYEVDCRSYFWMLDLLLVGCCGFAGVLIDVLAA